ncbi:triose-phosphate isomerase [Rickettsia endosymbiont of Cardiosporidium cionae]|uniref:triose-phosphate isomerase n=1 Tax=Rickettsia endosymbiont of Cardiosporidium cionae TaxID=2777155 RepID=UPI001893CFDF|nr:triose-phosphate isomerase family protein [Rickettsia endosymbiont of Cardiosporidium cionae]KAF8818650.1 triosephosphate isomerase [Rickettsia endosymbiont of Cardiosporidium cionae]
MPKMVIINWKMHYSLNESLFFLDKLQSLKNTSNFELIIAPPVPLLSYLLYKYTEYKFCTQNISLFTGYGSFTGEYSAQMIRDIGVEYAILGHSERKLYMNEKEAEIKIKVKNCLNAGITPIICVGEPITIRNSNSYKEFIKTQIINSVPQNLSGKKIILAYEPMWAIGSGKSLDQDKINEIFDFIKNNEDLKFLTENCCMVYGGSVGTKNYKNILSIENIGGLLLGSTSLKIDNIEIILRNV